MLLSLCIAFILTKHPLCISCVGPSVDGVFVFVLFCVSRVNSVMCFV